MRALALVSLALLLSSPLACVRLQEAPPAANDGESCAVDSDCTEGSRCTTGLCWSQECVVDYGGVSNCAAAEDVCYYGTCLPRQCDPAASSNPACGAYGCADSRCRTYCSDDYQCASGNVCREGACVSGYCSLASSPSVCQGTACDVATGECLSGYDCGTVGCAPGYLCDGFSCNKPCSNDVDCAPYSCDYDNTCRDDCYTNSDCADGYQCTSGMCRPR
ncbi:MAG TPA: hypothetical protein VLC09_14665 [Polyangiaceae bacterium]|nr:hypothetical protein [Polyangiaceae bacterium]